jgi:hypothetical protein
MGFLVVLGKLVLPVAQKPHHYIPTMGRGQVVRHQFLVLAFAGSNPAAPASKNASALVGAFLLLERWFWFCEAGCFSKLQFAGSVGKPTHRSSLRERVQSCASLCPSQA